MIEKMAGTTGLEPATSDVTGRRSASAVISVTGFCGNSSTPIESGIFSNLTSAVRRRRMPSF